MKKTLLLSFIIFISSLAFAQDKIKIKLSEAKPSLSMLIKTIESQSDYNFTYSEGDISLNEKTTIVKNTYSLKELLEIISKELSIKYIIVNKNIALRAKKQFSVSGILIDARTGETIIGANIYELTSNRGITTNAYGFYSLNLIEGYNKIEFSFIGYQTKIVEIDLKQNTRLAVSLEALLVEMQDVIVNGHKENSNISSRAMGKETISSTYLNSVMSIGGEPDIIKSLHTLSGVRAVADGSSQMSVRGGSFDQNLILLDEAQVYNPSHSLGFFSVFNTDAFKSTSIYKSYIPAKYGGRLSSVVDIRTKDGNKDKIQYQGGIGILASRLSIDGPINENTTFLISGRYSYAGHLLNAVAAMGVSEDLSKNSDISFYDLNLKLSHKINDKHRLYFSAYTGRDRFYYANINEKSDMKWGNITSTLRWNAILSDKLFLNTSLIYSKYDYSYVLRDESKNFDWTASFQDINLKCDFDYLLSDTYSLYFGGEIINNDIRPGEINPRNDFSNAKSISLSKQKAYQKAAYIDNKISISSALSLNLGMRITYIDSRKIMEDKYNTTFSNLEPRLSATYMLNESSSLKASYTKTNQYLHLMNNSALGFPTDVWLPANAAIKPQSAEQFSIGLYKNFANNKIETSIEVYSKRLDNVIDFIDNSNLFLNENIHEQILAGKGRAYGIDLSLKKMTGNTQFMANYSYARTFKTIEGINSGKEYPMIFDKPHSVNLFLSQQINDKLSISASWNYASGGRATMPIERFIYKGMTFMNYTSRNGYVLPATHSLDLMATYTQKHEKFESQWRFGIYNAYARHNTFALMIKPDDFNINDSKGQRMYLNSIMPTLTYCFKF